MKIDLTCTHTSVTGLNHIFPYFQYFSSNLDRSLYTVGRKTDIQHFFIFVKICPIEVLLHIKV